jgi:hypothetical protein
LERQVVDEKPISTKKPGTYWYKSILLNCTLASYFQNPIYLRYNVSIHILDTHTAFTDVEVTSLPENKPIAQDQPSPQTPPPKSSFTDAEVCFQWCCELRYHTFCFVYINLWCPCL